MVARDVATRSKQWLEIARARDPIDVGRLLATTWPGMGRQPDRWLVALEDLPDDPQTPLFRRLRRLVMIGAAHELEPVLADARTARIPEIASRRRDGDAYRIVARK